MPRRNKNQKPANNKPHFADILKPKALFYFVVLFIGIRIALSWLTFPTPATASDLTKENILLAINKERGLRNLVTLNTNDKLSQAAQTKTDDMITRKYFAHVNPEGHYIWDTIVADGYSPYLELGENLAIEFYNTETLVSAWMNSPTHRANILQDGFRDQGMGLGFGDTSIGQYGSAITNTFGTLLVKHADAAAPSATPTPKAVPKKTAAPTTEVSSPTPTPSVTPSSTGLPSGQTGSGPSATPSSASPTPNPVPLVGVRGIEQAGIPSFATPSVNSESTSTPTTTNATLHQTSKIPTQLISSPKLNRYLTFGFGVLLLLFLITDLGKAIELKTVFIDKKINNLFLLILSLIVVAFVYWL